MKGRGTAAIRPYVRALHELAKERQQSETVGRELETVAEAIAGAPQLREFFSRPWVGAGVKRAVAEELARRLQLSSLTRDLIVLVARKGRADHLEAIATAYRDLVDADLGRVRGRVRTVVALTAAERDRLQQQLGRALAGKQVLLEEVVDERLLGGFVAEVDGFIADGSLDGQLARLRERLARA